MTASTAPTTPYGTRGTGGSRAPASPRRLAAGAAVLVLAVVGAAVVSVLLGSRAVDPTTVLDALTNPDPSNREHRLVNDLRVPRTLTGLLAGAALGLAGALMQGVSRNPLADPGLLGVNAGAACGVVVAIGLLGIGTPYGYIWFAFAGATVAVVGVYTVASLGRDGATPVKLALAGAATTAALTAVTTAVLLVDTATFEQFRFWTVGALAGRRMEPVLQVAPFVAAGVALALLCGRVLNTLSLGDDVAAGLGQRVALARASVAGVAVVLCAGATALAGPIAFVGLVAPHAARLVTGADHRWTLPYAMLIAPVLLLVADIVGRTVARPGELQVGIVTAFVGAPFFIMLLRRRRLVGL